MSIKFHKHFAVSVAAVVLLSSALGGCGGKGNDFAPTKEGMVLTSRLLDGNGIKTGETRTTVRSVTRAGGKTEIVLAVRGFDAGGNEQYDVKSTVNIVKGVAEYDIASGLALMLRNEVKSADALRIPSGMKPGDILDDATIHMENVTVGIRDVKCEAVEEITVPAGTFKAHKVTYKMNIDITNWREQKKMFMETAEWYVKGIGGVRSVTTTTEPDRISMLPDGEFVPYTTTTTRSELAAVEKK